MPPDVKEPTSTDMLDWQIIRASRTPGPGAYTIPSTMEFKGGRWGKNISKDSLDWVIHYAKQTPGPGAYTLPDVKDLIPGGRMGTGERPKSDVDWAIHRAKQGPGPGQYTLPSTCLVAGASTRPYPCYGHIV
jgi:hypothetical protein